MKSEQTALSERRNDMKKILSKAKGFFDKYKKEKWFRYLAVITILIIFAAVVSAVDDFRDQEEKPPDTEETSIVSDFFEDSAVHILLICVISGGLAYVKYSDELKLKEKK